MEVALGKPCVVSEIVEAIKHNAAELINPDGKFDKLMFRTMFRFNFCDEIVDTVKSIGYRFKPGVLTTWVDENYTSQEARLKGARLLLEEYGVVAVISEHQSLFYGPVVRTIMGEQRSNSDHVDTRALVRLMESRINQLDQKIDRLEVLVKDLSSALAVRNGS